MAAALKTIGHQLQNIEDLPTIKPESDVRWD